MIFFATTVSAAACSGGWEYARDECMCYCREPALVFPPSGSELPTNAEFYVSGFNSPGWLQDGEQLAMTTEFSQTDAVETLARSRPNEPLTPGAVIELWALDVTPDVLVGTWTVGDGPDTEPPTWTGEYEVETIDDREDVCGFAEHSHYITWQGLSDGPLFVLAEGVGEDIDDELGDDGGFDVRWDGCTIDDLSLYDTFHREYRVTFEDAAGNTIGPFDVRTGRNVLGCGGPSQEEVDRVVGPEVDDTSVRSRDGCGCGAENEPFVPPATAALVLPLFFLFRRRRPALVRRLPPGDGR